MATSPAVDQPSFPLLDEPYPVTADHCEQFREDGFIKLTNVFDAETLAHFEREITELTFANNPLADTALADRDTYSKAFIQVGNLWEKGAEARRFTFSRRLASIAASGDRLRLPSMGATSEAAVITPTVVEPVIMLPMMPITNGSRMAGKP